MSKTVTLYNRPDIRESTERWSTEKANHDSFRFKHVGSFLLNNSPLLSIADIFVGILTFCFTSALNKASGKKQMGKHGNVKEMEKLRGKDYLTKDCIDPITFDGNLL